jgi:hypothetical protein
MPNLICFPHYTCGGLICDILADTFSPVTMDGGIYSLRHRLGKIGDTGTVLTDYNTIDFMEKISAIDTDDDAWIGTHCWPGNMPVDKFKQVLVITTTTFKSKIYRWARAHHHYFLPRWKELSGIELVDKTRETAKNYLIPFMPVFAPNVSNVEFADVVETTEEFSHAIDHRDCTKHIQRWKDINHFLYADKFWSSEVVNQFYQAEVEENLRRYYRYH